MEPDERTTKVLAALPTLAARRPEVTWVVPVESKDSYEPRNGAMVSELGLERLAPALEEVLAGTRPGLGRPRQRWKRRPVVFGPVPALDALVGSPRWPLRSSSPSPFDIG